VFKKSVIAVTKLSILDRPLSTIGIGSEGYGKPNRAQIAKTRNMDARLNNVYLDSRVRGDSVRSENVEISTRNRGRKNSSLNKFGEGGMGG